MSIAGIHSNRGDGYQTLVAFDWALTVLSDPKFDWIEIDSASYGVDDIVIGKTDGSMICCQCKKNQPKHTKWSVSDLSGELTKAFALLTSEPRVEVRFYSRTPFGVLSTLWEYNFTQDDEAGYLASLGKTHQPTESALTKLISHHRRAASSFDLLRRITFEPTPELDRMKTLLQERLRNLASNPERAFDALWRNLDELGARMVDSNASASTGHRLSKLDLQTILNKAGSLLTPPIDILKVRQSFKSASAIGRSWHRDIAGKQIHSSVLNDLIFAIEEKKRSILLTGLPGSGKTCVMLSLQDELERRAQTKPDIIPLFIQSREFADLATAKEREAQGLPGAWVKQAARIADKTQTVVIIDSLDVLSIAREHKILTYFLAQIDQLLLIPNITVVTACRDFDRRYDRRIAERQWESELKCEPFDWETEVSPLLQSLGIDTAIIDQETRDLIRNPRELALFVELAQHSGSFNAVTSQALAQKYLDVFVRSDNALGDNAMKAIENIANEMLLTRTLSVPFQKFSASQEILRILLSLNVLRETESGGLTFGHQTLLDVLVISRAIRQSVSLNEFILSLPPVPFVRPSIRSFVAQLATGDRREFRKQIRAVLTGSSAFHIRRLVAESFAEQIPQKNDWSLIRDLRNNHREIFQIIYIQAERIEWHHFWLKHLVPTLKSLKDKGGLATHIHQIARWKYQDPKGVLAFWSECLHLDWLENEQLVDNIPFHLEKIDDGHLALAAPLLEELLKLPRQQYSFLGHAVARYINAGMLDVSWLWHYITDEITDQDVLKYRFDQKLHCSSHEFGSTNNSFLQEQMCNSTTLLELAIKSVEAWSEIQSTKYTGMPRQGFHSHFHLHTSYKEIHIQRDLNHIDDEDILFQAIETAICDHAQNNSPWWKENRIRICFSKEGALRYIGIMCCISTPALNTDLIERILSTPDILRSKLSFELGSLLQAAFVLISPTVQDEVIKNILTLREDDIENGEIPIWVQRDRAEFVVAIPCHLRSETAQALLDEYEKENGIIFRLPRIEMWGGSVHAPFSFEVFLKLGDQGVLRLLDHYEGYDNHFEDFGTGGEREVGGQLREAASREPNRFLSFLSNVWDDIPSRFRNDIMQGVSYYLSYKHGNLQTGNNWECLEKSDDLLLATCVLDELERHPNHWYHSREASDIINACSHVIADTPNGERLVFLTISFASYQEEVTADEPSRDLLSRGFNMLTGHIVQALINLTNNLTNQNRPLPELLTPTLRRFARNAVPDIQAVFLDKLPYFQSLNHELGWELFYLCMEESSKGLWNIAERCLYYSYHDHFDEIVAPLLQRIEKEGNQADMETWGRISALSTLSSKIDNKHLVDQLISLESPNAWRGAAAVWTHTSNLEQNREQCLSGLEAGLILPDSYSKEVAQEVVDLFREENHHIHIPIQIIRLCISAFEKEEKSNRRDLFMFDAWVNARSQLDPDHALEAAEIYLSYMSRTKEYLHDYKDSLTQLMTRLFAESEEREESDQGKMLQRVVALQDTLLALGADSINDWLKSAERP